ncbi:MAG: long-chain fatty acid--CoA ligase [Verrucomicrobiales bacterium]|nr:long-chain fatty acid--CoA ligase [Verrucomicrobiales bacterium]
MASQQRAERALHEAATGRSWTFGELLAWSDRSSAPPTGRVFPQGLGADFILEVLRGWRHGCCVCPLEVGQEAPRIPPPPPGMVHLKLTSASTGSARMVAFQAGQLAADPAHIVATMGLRPDWPNLGAISLAHSYGFSNLVLPLLLHGIPLVLAASSLPEALRRAAAGEPALTLPGVPALWRAWHEADAIPAGVRLAISAGAPLPLELERTVFQQRGVKIHNFYGSSECGGIAYDRSPQPRSDDRSVGTAMQGVSLDVGADGCLRVRGPNVAETYWPDAAGPLGDGCFQTTDLAEFHGDELHLLGRAGDVIHVAGRKVAPEAIEQTLRHHTAIRDCLVFGVPAARVERGEQIVAVVAGTDLAPGDLAAFAAGSLPDWQVPRQWWVVDSLDPDPRGKLSRREWCQRFLSRRQTGGVSPEP